MDYVVGGFAIFFVVALVVRVYEGYAYYRLKQAETDLRRKLRDLA